MHIIYIHVSQNAGCKVCQIVCFSSASQLTSKVKYIDISFEESFIVLMVGLELHSNFPRCAIDKAKLLSVYLPAQLCRRFGITVAVHRDIVVFADSIFRLFNLRTIDDDYNTGALGNFLLPDGIQVKRVCSVRLTIGAVKSTCWATEVNTKSTPAESFPCVAPAVPNIIHIFATVGTKVKAD